MTIEEMGSIGELLAAIATIATLIYLARELRANTAAVRGEARRAYKSASSAVNLAIGSDAAVAAVFNEGLRDPTGLSPEHRTQFSFLMAELLGVWHAAHAEFAAGILDEEALRGVAESTMYVFATPGGREWWKVFGPGFPDAFREHVEATLGRATGGG